MSYYYDSMDDGLNGLSYAGDDAAVFSLGGIGMMAARNPAAGMLTAIVKADAQLKNDVRKANQQKVDAARRDPLVAVKLQKTARIKAQQGTNVQSAIIGAMNDASMEAKKALARKKRAAVALRRGDRQQAAAEAISYMQHLRRASINATKAEKTRLAVAADRVAFGLEEQANIIEMAAKKQINSGGRNGQTDRMLAQVTALRSRASRLRAQAASIATLPDAPSSLPSERRIADLANKYNIRTSIQQRADDNRALISVLSDISNAAMAQVEDYPGAVSYYGNDLSGKLMADVEYGNIASFLQGLGALDQAELKANAATAEAAMDAALAPKQASNAAPTPAQTSQQQAQGATVSAGDILNFLNSTQKNIQTGVQVMNATKSTVNTAASAVGVKAPFPTRAPTIISSGSSMSRYKSGMAPAKFTPYVVAASRRTPPPAPKGMSTTMMVSIAAGGLALVGAGWYFMKRRPAA